MTHRFDKPYWESQWTAAPAPAFPVNPYVVEETRQLEVGSALDAGCGTGTESLWLARQGWQVTGVDISATALAAAAERAVGEGLDDRIDWVEADLTRWAPDRSWDLVVTSYAHAASGQLALYRRLAEWVAPGGALLIVGHLHAASDHPHAQVHGHEHPEGATTSLREIEGLLSGPTWRIQSAFESTRTVQAPGREVELRDVVVRAHRSV